MPTQIACDPKTLPTPAKNGTGGAQKLIGDLIGILDPTRQGYSTVVGEHVAIEQVQGGIVEVRGEHTGPYLLPTMNGNGT
jgi:hypothetical protein